MPVDVLVKFTVSGAVPEVGLPVNCATGAARGDRDVVGARLRVAAARAGHRERDRVGAGRRVDVARTRRGAGAAVAEGPGVAGDRCRSTCC